MDNNSIINKAAIQTTALSSGLLNPEQARKFILQTFEATKLGGLIRKEMRTAKTGEIRLKEIAFVMVYRRRSLFF